MTQQTCGPLTRHTYGPLDVVDAFLDAYHSASGPAPWEAGPPPEAIVASPETVEHLTRHALAGAYIHGDPRATPPGPRFGGLPVIAVRDHHGVTPATRPRYGLGDYVTWNWEKEGRHVVRDYLLGESGTWVYSITDRRTGYNGANAFANESALLPARS